MRRNYDDIIHLSRPKYEKHPPMPLIDRAAQFSPFAALTGYEAAVKETARLTEERVDLEEETKAILNEKLRYLAENPQTEAVFMYFQPDKKKSGGAYVSVTGLIKEIDEYECAVILTDGTKIPIQQIHDIQSELFTQLGYE